MKNILKKTIMTLIVISILMYSTRSFAESLNSLQNEKKDVNSQIHETEGELEEITNVKTATLAQVEKLISQISTYQGDIEDLNTQIKELKSKIKKAEEQIKLDEEEYKKKQELLNARLVAMYKNGGTSYLDFLLSSANLMDFISSYYLISQVTEYDQKMLEELAKHKKKIESEKQQMETNKKEIESSQATLESKMQALQVIKKEKEQYVAKLTEEEKEAEKKLQELQDANDELDKRIKKAKAEIAAAKAAAAKKTSGNNTTSGAVSTGKASSYGLIWPTLSRYSVTTGWYYSTGKLHGASDISGAGIYGTPIYAASSGYVIVSEAKVNSSGKYIGYGNYVMIAHYNGLYTLYGHMSKRVAVTGQTVTQGQVIGYVGSTGNSTGPHLHFEVRTGNGTYSERVNPIYYLPSK